MTLHDEQVSQQQADTSAVEWFDFAVYSELAPAYYDTVAAIISLATVLTMRETAARPLRKRVTA